MGFGYLWVLTGISIVRELFGNGTFIGMTLIPEQYTIGFFTGAPGGFFVFAIFIAVTRLIRVAYEKNKGEQK
jgi:electron transport complex protein RnfE